MNGNEDGQAMRAGQGGVGSTARFGGLMGQFIVLAGVVLVTGMIGTGLWVRSQIEGIATDHAAAVTALYVDAVVTPLAQELAHAQRLSPQTDARLHRMLEQGALSREISAFKLWRPDGVVVYSTRPELLGRQFRDNPRLAVALTGQVHAQLRDVAQGPQVRRLMEVYSPIRSARTGQIIAVAEFYTSTDKLDADLARSRSRSWLVVGAVTLAMFLALYTLFSRGSRTILRQRRALDEKIRELSALLAQNRALADSVVQANRRSAEIGERTLRRLSADLHDGPAQHLGFAALRLDGVPGFEQVAHSVNEALQELRFICRGMALPELQAWSAERIAHRLVSTHEARNGPGVHLDLQPDLPQLPLAAKNCLYRFLQETLANSARHAPGAGTSVIIRRSGDGLLAEVSDSGPGFDPRAETAGLGLAGLRERIAAMKGRFELHSGPQTGTCVTMWLPLSGKGDLA